MARSFKALAVALARAASDKKGEEPVVLHVGRSSPVADYMLIVTANSPPHLEALESEVEKAALALRTRTLRHARPQSDQWRVLDFGGLLVHLMTADARQFYALEKLYAQSPRVRWEEAAKDRRHAGARSKTS